MFLILSVVTADTSLLLTSPVDPISRDWLDLFDWLKLLKLCKIILDRSQTPIVNLLLNDFILEILVLQCHSISSLENAAMCIYDRPYTSHGFILDLTHLRLYSFWLRPLNRLTSSETLLRLKGSFIFTLTSYIRNSATRVFSILIILT